MSLQAQSPIRAVTHLARPHLFIQAAVQLVLVSLVHACAQCQESLLRNCDLGRALLLRASLISTHGLHVRGDRMLWNVDVFQSAA